MLVSVIVPAYNAAATIAQTLQSVCEQSCDTWQAVVVNDGSTDATNAIARAFAARDPRVTVVDQPNKGEAAARNTGVRAALHPWLLFLDSDDWIAPRHLELMTGRLNADASLDAVLCGYARVAGDGALVIDPYRPPGGDLFPILARRAAFPVHACVVRRTLVEDVGLFDPSLRTSADWDLWQRVARAGATFAVLDDVLAFYRMSPRGRSLEAVQLFKDGMRILRRGQMADPRVSRPRPAHAHGTGERLHTQQFYLLTWCAGLLLGQHHDPWYLFTLATKDTFPALFAPAIAQCLFESVPLSNCQPPAAWTRLAPVLAPAIARFLGELERHSGSPGLAQAVSEALRTRVAALEVEPPQVRS